jgi:hypothetical protein
VVRATQCGGRNEEVEVWDLGGSASAEPTHYAMLAGGCQHGSLVVACSSNTTVQPRRQENICKGIDIFHWMTNHVATICKSANAAA